MTCTTKDCRRAVIGTGWHVCLDCFVALMRAWS